MPKVLSPVQLIDGSEAVPAINFINEPSSGIIRSSNGVLALSIGGTSYHTFSISAISLASSGSAEFNFTDFSGGLRASASYDSIDDVLALGHGSEKTLNIAASGKVGIGTSSPAFPLDVLGDVNFGALAYNSTGMRTPFIKLPSGEAISGYSVVSSVTDPFDPSSFLSTSGFYDNNGGISISGSFQGIIPRKVFPGAFIVQDINSDGSGTFGTIGFAGGAISANGQNGFYIGPVGSITGTQAYGSSPNSLFIKGQSSDYFDPGVIISGSTTGSAIGGAVYLQSGLSLGAESDSAYSGVATASLNTDTLTFSINSEIAQTITLSANSSGSAIAADIQSKIRALTAQNSQNQYAYRNISVTFGPYDTRYHIVVPADVLNGIYTNSIAVTGGTFAVSGKLGIANGGVEYSGGIGQVLISTPQGASIAGFDPGGLSLFAGILRIAPNNLQLLNGNPLSITADAQASFTTSTQSWTITLSNSTGKFEIGPTNGNSTISFTQNPVMLTTITGSLAVNSASGPAYFSVLDSQQQIKCAVPVLVQPAPSLGNQNAVLNLISGNSAGNWTIGVNSNGGGFGITDNSTSNSAISIQPGISSNFLQLNSGITDFILLNGDFHENGSLYLSGTGGNNANLILVDSENQQWLVQIENSTHDFQIFKGGTGAIVTVASSTSANLISTDFTTVTINGNIQLASGWSYQRGSSNIFDSGTPDSAFSDKETPSGAVDGSNSVFILVTSPISGSDHVFLNGLLQDVGVGNDYTISGAIITFNSAPPANSKLRVSYRK